MDKKIFQSLSNRETKEMKVAIRRAYCVEEWEEKICEDLCLDPWQVNVVKIDDVLDPRLKVKGVNFAKVSLRDQGEAAIAVVKEIQMDGMPAYWVYVIG